MPLTIEGVATGLDNGRGRLTKLFIRGSGFEEHFKVEIREKSGPGFWSGRIQRVYDNGHALVHVNTIEKSTVSKDRKTIELDVENVEIVVTDENGDSASGDGAVPIFP